MTRRVWLRPLALLCSVLALPAVCLAEPASPGAPLPIVGRWDVTVTAPDGARQPSWFEIREDAHGLAMRMVGRYGSPFDVPFVAWDGRHVEFQLADGTRWRGEFNGRWLRGSVESSHPAFVFDGVPQDVRAFLRATGRDHALEPDRWTAVRAPELPARDVRWGRPEALFDGRTLAGWRPRHEHSRSGWTVRDGVLANTHPADDLVSLEFYKDFTLRLQFRLQPGEDSGVHLRGRYEVQITDRADDAGSTGGTGAIYGRIAPESPVRAVAGQWHTLEVTLVGRQVSVALDGERIIDRRLVTGITGDALDADEGRPGPIVLQGYLGRVEFRDIEVTPAL